MTVSAFLPTSAERERQLLQQVTSTNEMDTVLHRSCPDIRREYGDFQVVSARVVRHKPGKRALVKLECKNEASQPFHILGKLRTKGLDQTTPRLHRRLRAAGLQAPQATRVPKPLGCVKHLHLWLQEHIHGKPLDPCEATFADEQSAVAHALVALHSLPIRPRRVHSLADEWSILTHRFQALEATYPEQARRARLVLHIGLQRSERIARARNPSTIIHRDFYFDQCLLADRSVYLLDFDLCAQGAPECDVGNYLAHLIEIGLRFPNYSWQSLSAGRNFLNSYLELSPQSCPDLIECWTFLSLARHISLSTQLPGRRHTTEALFVLLLKGASHSLLDLTGLAP